MARCGRPMAAPPLLRGLCALLLSLAVSGSSRAAAADPRRVLVLVESMSLQATHSTFFKSLEDAGSALEFRLADEEDLRLHEWEVYKYDALVLFAPSVEEFGGQIDVPAILDFIDTGHDLILAAGTSISETVREVATECGVDFDEAGTSIIDHFAYNAAAGSNERTLVLSQDYLKSEAIMGTSPPTAPVAYRGIAMSVSPEAVLVTPALYAGPSAYSARPGVPLAEVPLVAGSRAVLAALVQARNDARVLVAGSLDLFSDAFATMVVQPPPGGEDGGLPHDPGPTGNGAFVAEAATWTLHGRGQLRAGNVTHRAMSVAGAGAGAGAGAVEDGPVDPAEYRIRDHIRFSMRIEERRGGRWVPYKADDVQLEFVMLDPYVRVNMRHDMEGNYVGEFQAPDVYGVFKLRVSHHREGKTALDVESNEYERFIPVAYPYYVSAFSMVVGFVIFSAFFLFSAPP